MCHVLKGRVSVAYFVIRCKMFRNVSITHVECNILRSALWHVPQVNACMTLYGLFTGAAFYALSVPRRSVHRQTDHTTFRPKRSIHPTNRLLWQFTTVTFRLKVDGLSVHPKLWHCVLKTWTGCHVETLRPTVIFVPEVCDISPPIFRSIMK